jgi:hypothetical protein
MGTNYYAVKIEPTVREDRIIHIGKSSAGWKFLFHEHAGFEELGLKAYCGQPRGMVRLVFRRQYQYDRK